MSQAHGVCPLRKARTSMEQYVLWDIQEGVCSLFQLIGLALYFVGFCTLFLQAVPFPTFLKRQSEFA